MRKWLHQASFTLFPGVCLLCGSHSGRELDLCDFCETDLPRPVARCQRCALPMPADGLCGTCLTHPPAFDRAWCPFVYASPVDQLIQRFKHSSGIQGGRLLATLLASHWHAAGLPTTAWLLPVPLHRKRRRQRGFNQAEEIADVLGCNLGLEIVSHLAKRTRPGRDQKSLPMKMRRENIQGAFIVDPAVGGERIIIVDDVITTGATVSELARTLRQAGAARVDVVALARTPDVPHRRLTV